MPLFDRTLVLKRSPQGLPPGLYIQIKSGIFLIEEIIV